MSRTSPVTLQELITGFRAVRAEVIEAVSAIPADACFRGEDSTLSDTVRDLLLPAEVDDYLAQLKRTADGAHLGPIPDWESRREGMICRYYFSVQAVINFANSINQDQLQRTGTRDGRPTTLYHLLLGNLQRDTSMGIKLRRECIPRALGHKALARPLLHKADPSARVEQRCQAAAAEVDELAITLQRLLEPITWEQASLARDPKISDLFLHWSDKHQLLRMTKRMLIEDNPALGVSLSQQSLWGSLWSALVGQMRMKAQRWREVDSSLLRRQGNLGGRPYSAIMAIEEMTERYREGVQQIEAKVARILRPQDDTVANAGKSPNTTSSAY